MPDGNAWCSFTISFCYGCSDRFEPGNPKIFKPLPQEVLPISKIKKVERKEVKPKISIKTIKKIEPPQKRLF